MTSNADLRRSASELGKADKLAKDIQKAEQKWRDTYAAIKAREDLPDLSKLSSGDYAKQTPAQLKRNRDVIAAGDKAQRDIDGLTRHLTDLVKQGIAQQGTLNDLAGRVPEDAQDLRASASALGDQAMKSGGAVTPPGAARSAPAANSSDQNGPSSGWRFGPVHAYTPEELAQAANQAGFSGSALTQAVAVALAESNGVSEQSKFPGEQSFGVTQINVPSHPQYDAQRLLDDPVYAFQAMYEISNGGKDFSAWTTVSGNKAINLAPGAYLSHMDVAAKASTTVDATAGGSAVPPPAPSSSTAPSDAITPQSTPAQVEAYIYKHYSDVAPFLANPEIKKILLDSAVQGRSDSEVGHLLAQTDYYHTHSAASRSFDMLIGTDPASATELITESKTLLSNVFTRQGVHVDDAMLNATVKTAIRSGLIGLNGQAADPQGLQTLAINMLQQQNPAGSLPAGKTAVTADDLAKISKSYMVPMTSADLAKIAMDIGRGVSDVANFTHDMSQHSRTLFQNDPDILSAIDAGKTPTDYFTPIRNQIAATLEKTPDQIDFTNPKYSGIVQMYDPKMANGGGRRAMTLGEAQQWARNQPEFKDTKTYQGEDARFGLEMARTFGAIK